MVQAHLFDDNGHFYLGRACRKKWGDTGVLMDSGPSYAKISECIQEEIQRIENLAPWTRDSHLSQWRSAFDALTCLVSDHLDSECVSGYSYFHYKLINEDDLLIVNDDIAAEWNIDVGEKYHIWEQPLRTSLKGDDSKFKKWPQASNNVSLVFIFAFLWNCGLAHCKFSSMCTLISGESCHSEIVKSNVQEQVVEMNIHKKLVVWCDKKQCWCCYHLKFHFCSDWIFECSVFGLSSPTSKYFCHGIAKLEKGDPRPIEDNAEKLWDAFDEGIIPANFDIDLESCLENEIDGYCLTNNDIIQYYGEYFVKELAITKKNGKKNWEDLEYQKKRRNVTAKNSRTGLLYNPSNWYYCLLTETFHAFDAYVAHLIKYAIFAVFCGFTWHRDETQLLVDELGE